MAVITMWRRGDVKCEMVLTDKGVSLCLLDGTSIIREQVVEAQWAASLAERWEFEDGYDRWHNSTLAVFA